MPNSELTLMEEGIYVCNNCGAFADSPEKIEHYATCQAGESEKWKSLYDEANEIERTWQEEHYDHMFN